MRSYKLLAVQSLLPTFSHGYSKDRWQSFDVLYHCH